MVDLRAYFERIGFEGEARPDLATLEAVHRGHSLAIPYENLDVQLKRPLTTSAEAAFDKLVRQRRGGWCYEMNGTLGLALQAIGFSVTRMAGGVVRALAGDGQVGNHLVLRVDMDGGPMIADVGFGDGPIAPYPLAEGPFRSGAFDYRLEDLKDGWWRLHNSLAGGAPNFDFRPERADEALLAERCAFLQTAEVSPFVQNLVVQRHIEGGLKQLRGRVLRTVRGPVSTDRLLESAAELVAVLQDDFGLDTPEAASLWDGIVARHETVFRPIVEA